MLTIKKIEDIREAEAYLKAHGISHNIANEQAMGVYTQSGLIGLGSFEGGAGRTHTVLIGPERDAHAYGYTLRAAAYGVALIDVGGRERGQIHGLGKGELAATGLTQLAGPGQLGQMGLGLGIPGREV